MLPDVSAVINLLQKQNIFSAIYSAPLMYFGEYKGRLLVMFLSFMGISEIQLTLKVDKIKRFLKKVSIYRKKSDVTA